MAASSRASTAGTSARGRERRLLNRIDIRLAFHEWPSLLAVTGVEAISGRSRGYGAGLIAADWQHTGGTSEVIVIDRARTDRPRPMADTRPPPSRPPVPARVGRGRRRAGIVLLALLLARARRVRAHAPGPRPRRPRADQRRPRLDRARGGADGAVARAALGVLVRDAAGRAARRRRSTGPRSCARR